MPFCVLRAKARGHRDATDGIDHRSAAADIFELLGFSGLHPTEYIFP
jgi:hypothetical protein